MIFLSHAAVDVELARFLDDAMRDGGTDVHVFRTTRRGQIESGRPWFEHIIRNLQVADQFAILLTPFSQTRPWVCFEAGAALQTGKKVVPILGGGLTREALVEPIKSIQALSLELADDAEQVFAELGLTLTNPTAFVAEARRLGAVSRGRSLAAAGWKQVEVDGVQYVWEGPLADLKEGDPVPLPAGLVNALGKAGLTAQFGIPGKLLREQSQGFLTIWKINLNFGTKHLVLSQDAQALIARPQASALIP